jgi:hypothetical protein
MAFNQSNLVSVLGLLVDAIQNQDLTMIQPLIGDQGTTFAAYGTEFDMVGYNNSEELIPQLTKALNKSNLICMGYDNSPSYNAMIYFKGDVDWSQFPQKINQDSTGIVFGLMKEQQDWNLMFVTKLPGFALSDAHGHECPPFLELQAAIPTLAPLDPKDDSSVLQWIRYALANNDPSVFEQLTPGDLTQLIDSVNRTATLKRGDFLAGLAERLPSKPQCDFFMLSPDGKQLFIQMKSWSPAWEMKEFCHLGCTPMDPPLQNSSIVLSLDRKENGWTMSTMGFNGEPNNTNNTIGRLYPLDGKRVSCDSLPGSATTVPPLPAAPQLLVLNQAEYFSLLQWMKYAALSGDVSVFEKSMTGDSIQLIDGSNSPVTISTADLLAALSKGLLNRSVFEYFMFDSSDKDAGRLILRTSGWSPPWGSHNSTTVYFVFEMVKNRWTLKSIFLGEQPSTWEAGLERISFDKISLSVGNAAEPVCKEVRPTRLKDGDFAFISFYPPLNQRVRSNFGTTSTILDLIPPGTAVKITDGPECADNWVWWKVKVLNSGLTGWVAEGDQDTYWLIPCASKDQCGTR